MGVLIFIFKVFARSLAVPPLILDYNFGSKDRELGFRGSLKTCPTVSQTDCTPG